MMMENTLDRIVMAALKLFLDQGVKKTTLTDVAFVAGVTRITVYRYFRDKRELIRAVLRKLVGYFQRAVEEGATDSIRDIDSRLSQLSVELSSLPKGNLFARLEEINRLYPDLYNEYRTSRQTALDNIFHQALHSATQDGTLRAGLNLEVLKAIFWSSVIGLFENQTLISSNIPISEIFDTVTELFRHGILKNTKEDK
jgi:AcrR family transcriptional regulator